MNGPLVTLCAMFAQLSLLAFGGANTILPDLQRQVVDVHGMMDAAISLDLAQHLRILIPGFQQMTIIDSAGHAANLTHPDVTNRAIREFLDTAGLLS